MVTRNPQEEHSHHIVPPHWLELKGLFSVPKVDQPFVVVLDLSVVLLSLSSIFDEKSIQSPNQFEVIHRQLIFACKT